MVAFCSIDLKDRFILQYLDFMKMFLKNYKNIKDTSPSTSFC